jgi:hypothetical protein
MRVTRRTTTSVSGLLYAMSGASKPLHIRSQARATVAFIALCLPLLGLRYGVVPLQAFQASEKRANPVHCDGPLPSRFHVPWERIPYIRLPTLIESKNKIVYSAYATKSVDGLGHALATFNAEVFASLSLRLTYSHRIASFGSLTRTDPMAIDNFFGLGDGELSRQTLQANVCDITPELWDKNQGPFSPRMCPVCTALQKRSPKTPRVDRIVQLPSLIGAQEPHLRLLRDKFSKLNFTLFTLNTDRCDKLGAHRAFWKTAPVFYWKYWHRHGLDSCGRRLARVPESETSNASRELNLTDAELTICLHARRGDFLLKKSRRKPTSSVIFVKLLVEAIRIIRQKGGSFASLRPAIHIYSEGVERADAKAGGHDVANFSPTYIDVDGTEQSETWWQEQLFETTVIDGEDTPPWQLPRVIMHVARPTLASLHEMVSGDVFIGSDSGFSANLVRSLARGVILLPCR